MIGTSLTRYRVHAATLTALALLLSGPGSFRADSDSGKAYARSPGQPSRLGFVEKTGVSLTLLDVEVNDDHGKPIRGLKKEDFRVWLNSREWTLYSVDDLCTCRDDTGAERSAQAAGKGPPRAARGSSGMAAPASGASSSSADQAVASDAPTSGGGAAPPSVAPDSGKGEAPSAGREAATTPEGGPNDLRFVLYFDFGHLATDGRKRAIKEANRWVREVKAPADLVAVYGHSPKAGLREICPFTSDVEKLASGIRQAETDPALQETWPSFHQQHWEECAAAAGGTEGNPRARFTLAGESEMRCREILGEEHRRGEQALRGLKDVLESLGAVPGRKALVFFNQTGAVQTGAIYPDVRLDGMLAGIRDTTPTHRRLVDQLAAEATLARTTINTAYVGDRLAVTPDRRWELDLSEGALATSAVLAESTGGIHNLDLSDLRSLTSGIRDRCACVYRLGLEARPDDPHGRVYQARVEVRGRLLEPRYRVTFLNEVDRWIRQARSVLRNPTRARDLGVGAALVPVRASGGAWDLAVQLAIDAASIEFVPATGGKAGPWGSDASWEAGALLAREEDDKHWEMLGISGAHRAAESRDARDEEAVLHEHVFTGVLPGRYKLAAFIKDRSASLYGGAEATLELPEPRGDALTTPVLLLDSRRHVTAPLPLFRAKDKSVDAHSAASRAGAIPAPGRSVRRGEVLLAVTFSCPNDKRSESRPSFKRFISKDGRPLFRLPEPRTESAGDCSRLTDRIETDQLEPGTYAYTIEPGRDAKSPPTPRTATFTIIPAPAAPPTPQTF